MSDLKRLGPARAAPGIPTRNKSRSRSGEPVITIVEPEWHGDDLAHKNNRRAIPADCVIATAIGNPGARLWLCPIRFREATTFIRRYHRHHGPPRGWLFGISARLEDTIVGVITVGRPVARLLDDGFTAEVTRCCTVEVPNTASMLYSAAWRACRAMGYQRLITYTLESESGTSLRAAGWRIVGATTGGSWNRARRPRTDSHPIVPKVLWQAAA